MARKQDTKKKPGIVGRIVRAAARRVLSPLLGAPKEERRETPKLSHEHLRHAHVAPPPRRGPERVLGGTVEPIETLDRKGAARDERSFEQRRRGGPMTGAVPVNEGPHHAGGGRRRGRDAAGEILDALDRLPIVDYDELSVEEIAKRVDGLGPRDIRALMTYEVANQHRKSVVSLFERKLAA